MFAQNKLLLVSRLRNLVNFSTTHMFFWTSPSPHTFFEPQPHHHTHAYMLLLSVIFLNFMGTNLQKKQHLLSEHENSITKLHHAATSNWSDCLGQTSLCDTPVQNWINVSFVCCWFWASDSTERRRWIEAPSVKKQSKIRQNPCPSAMKYTYSTQN